MAHLRSKRSPFLLRGSFSYLLASLRLVFHPKTLLEGVDPVPYYTTDVPNRPEHFPPEPDRSPLTDPDVLCEHLVDLVRHLRPLLPGSCEWLGQGSLEVVGDHPVDAGGIADVWIGKVDNRRVAVKSYRFHSSSDHLPTYMVSGTHPWRVIYSPKVYPAEVL